MSRLTKETEAEIRAYAEYSYDGHYFKELLAALDAERVEHEKTLMEWGVVRASLEAQKLFNKEAFEKRDSALKELEEVKAERDAIQISWNEVSNGCLDLQKERTALLECVREMVIALGHYNEYQGYGTARRVLAFIRQKLSKAGIQIEGDGK